MLSNYQVLNAESRKYFQQILLLSGTAIDFNAVSDIDHVDEMYAFAQNISQPAANLTKLIEVLQNAPAKQLLDFTSKPDLKKLAMRDWAPVIERMYTIAFTSHFMFRWKMFVVVVFPLFRCGGNIMTLFIVRMNFHAFLPFNRSERFGANRRSTSFRSISKFTMFEYHVAVLFYKRSTLRLE